jgi:hypothetical protein
MEITFGIGLIVCLVALVGGLSWLVRYILVTLPNLQLNTLKTFAGMAVTQVKLRYPLFEDLQQKQSAIERLNTIFQEFSIFHPGHSAIEVAIDDAFYRYDQEKIKMSFEKAKGDIKKEILADQNTSAVLPIVLPKTTQRTPKFMLSGE